MSIVSIIQPDQSAPTSPAEPELRTTIRHRRSTYGWIGLRRRSASWSHSAWRRSHRTQGVDIDAKDITAW